MTITWNSQSLSSPFDIILRWPLIPFNVQIFHECVILTQSCCSLCNIISPIPHGPTKWFRSCCKFFSMVSNLPFMFLNLSLCHFLWDHPHLYGFFIRMHEGEPWSGSLQVFITTCFHWSSIIHIGSNLNLLGVLWLLLVPKNFVILWFEFSMVQWTTFALGKFANRALLLNIQSSL